MIADSHDNQEYKQSHYIEDPESNEKNEKYYLMDFDMHRYQNKSGISKLKNSLFSNSKTSIKNAHKGNNISIINKKSGKNSSSNNKHGKYINSSMLNSTNLNGVIIKNSENLDLYNKLSNLILRTKSVLEDSVK